ncbi:BQ2448_3666 [Microbotryum intermedium]|uniref:BQ2448_3666 protein n=1 Tax=Microbotryum intermedium TaxID=269621 RepID=A0A238FG94_9BASI|nr:BQ2448_3666 [Microbotryum intermedium]
MWTQCKYVTNVTCTCSNSIYAKMFQECIINGCNNTADVSSIVDFGLATCKLLNITPDTGGLKGSNSNHNIVNSASSSLHAALCICMGLVTLGLANLV